MAGNCKILQPLCFFLSAFPLRTYLPTPLARQPPISILNYSSPKRRFTLRIQSFFYSFLYLKLFC